MSPDQSRLSRIDTLWSVVHRAHSGSPDDVRSAQEVLLDRYGGAVRRYLRACLRDDHAADEVFQEFALRLVRGDFRKADPSHGRFRGFVKTALRHLVVDFRRRTGRRHQQLAHALSAPAVDAEAFDDESFYQCWRELLLDRSWAALAEAEKLLGTPYFSALRMLADKPDMRSAEVAGQLTGRLGRTFSAGNARVIVHRARQMFADNLVDEVTELLADPSLDEVEQELIDLKLFEYCRQAVLRRRESQAAAAAAESGRTS